MIALNVAKAERARFSHALIAEVKKIIRNLRGATISRKWIGPATSLRFAIFSSVEGLEVAGTMVADS